MIICFSGSVVCLRQGIPKQIFPHWNIFPDIKINAPGYARKTGESMRFTEWRFHVPELEWCKLWVIGWVIGFLLRSCLRVSFSHCYTRIINLLKICQKCFSVVAETWLWGQREKIPFLTFYISCFYHFVNKIVYFCSSNSSKKVSLLTSLLHPVQLRAYIFSLLLLRIKLAW